MIRFFHLDGRASSLPPISAPDVFTLAYLSKPNLLVSGHRYGRLALWDITTGRVVSDRSEYKSRLIRLWPSPDQSSLLVLDNVSAYIWDIPAFEEREEVITKCETVAGLFLSDSTVILADLCKEISLYSLAAKTKPSVITTLNRGMPYYFTYSDKRNELYIFTGFNVIRYSMKERKILRFFPDSTDNMGGKSYGHYATIGLLSTQQDLLIAADFESNYILILDALTGAIHRKLTIPEDGIHQIALSTDDKILFTRKGFVRAWDWQTGKELFHLLG